jgi:flavodoxin
MRIAIVYGSEFGNTEQLARAIAYKLGTDGISAVSHDPSVEGVDLLIVGAPTQGHGVMPEVRDWVDGLPPGAGMAAAVFDTRFDKPAWLTGSAAQGIAKRLRRKGYRLVVPPESFFVEKTEGPLAAGEASRAAAWAEAMVAAQVAA